jgi:hypothetical protein
VGRAHVLRDTASVGKRTPTLSENSKFVNSHHVSPQRRRSVVDAKRAALQSSPQRRRCTGVLSGQDNVRVGSMQLPASGRLTG